MKRVVLGWAWAAIAIVACGGAPPVTKPVVQEVAIAPVADAGAPVAAPAPASEPDAAVPIANDDATWGDPDALVTMVEFADFQCPFSARVTATLEELRRAYGPHRLRIVYKNEPLPFHKSARDAAEAAAAVRALGGDAAFWRFHDQAFANQDRLSTDSYVAWAHEIGVDMAAFSSALATHAYAGKVDRDHALAKEVHVNGTPQFFINGVPLGGARPLDKFKTVIDAELTRAQALVDNGVPRSRVYVLATNENVKAWPKEEEKKETPPDTSVHRVPIAGSPVRGSKDALVTIVELGDFQCPFCKRVQDPLKQVREKYGDAVRIVWKDEPLSFHPRARPTAELAREARAEKGDAGFWAAHDALFAAQPKLDDADLEQVARDLKLDVAKVKSAIAKDRYDRAIEADSELADDLEASGTPHFFINGKRLIGAQPYEKFAAMVDAALADARERVAKGTKADRVYDEIMKDAVGPAAPERITLPRVKAAPWRGAASGPVVIQEVGDYQCPFTKRAEDKVDALLKAYPGKVRLEWRNLPLPNHADAPLAAEAALEAYAQKGSAGFAKMHALIFKNQATMTRADLDGFAREVGLDGARFAAALDARTHQAEVDADKAAVGAASIRGTPTFAINGYLLKGDQPLSRFRKLVDLALADAKAGKR